MRIRIMLVLIACLMGFFLALPALAFEPQAPGPDDRCPVCGMFVAKYPEWVATFVLQDGEQIFFDGAKDMFRYYFRLPQERLTREDIRQIYVTEYYTARFVPADEVFFVLGSEQLGPMGAELVPVAGRQQAETFMRDYNGKQIVTFEQVTPELLPLRHR